MDLPCSKSAKVGLAGFHLIVPSKRVAEAFGKKIATLRSRVVANVAESGTLAALRDTLLPKLISGELHVRAAERLVEMG
jgi:type I restriction enzyme S subunit